MPIINAPLFEKIEKLCQGELFRKVFSDEDVPTYNSENGSLENVTEDVYNILKEVFDVEQLSLDSFETRSTFIVPAFEVSDKKTFNIIKWLEEKLKALDEDFVEVDEVQESLEDDFVLTQMSKPIEEKRISWENPFLPKPSAQHLVNASSAQATATSASVAVVTSSSTGPTIAASQFVDDFLKLSSSKNNKNNYFFKGQNLEIIEKEKALKNHLTKPEDDFQRFISGCSRNKKLTNLLLQASEEELEALRRAVTGEVSVPSARP